MVVIIFEELLFWGTRRVCFWTEPLLLNKSCCFGERLFQNDSRVFEWLFQNKNGRNKKQILELSLFFEDFTVVDLTALCFPIMVGGMRVREKQPGDQVTLKDLNHQFI